MMSEALVARIRYHIKKANFMGLKDAESTILLGEAADAIDELSKCLEDAHNEGYDVGYWAGRRDYYPKWIPVTERLPKMHQWVLVASKLVKIRMDFISSDGHWYTTSGVTHWMPLPEPPEGEENENI